ncbi:MAG: DUF1003 domain-containing protein [bacterium]|nr:DUF1003 domain-containing protein [bacterium]
MPMHKPLKLEELKVLGKKARNINIEHRERLSRLEKSALFVTERIGTMGFFFIILAWTVLWIGWNALAPAGLRFDPFPAFVLWLFMSNIIQLHLLPLLLVGQNLLARHQEARAEADFEVNARAEREIETILQHLENQGELISEILRRLEKN